MACRRTQDAPASRGDITGDRPAADRPARDPLERRARAPVQKASSAAAAAARPGVRRQRLDGTVFTRPDDLRARDCAPRRTPGVRVLDPDPPEHAAACPT